MAQAERKIIVGDLRVWELDKSDINRGLHGGWLRTTTIKASLF
jgi:hypothetical protein